MVGTAPCSDQPAGTVVQYATMYGYYALPVTAPQRSVCDVCGAPAQFARVRDGRTLGAWCGAECAAGCRAGDLPLGAEVLVSITKFDEVSDWSISRHAEDQYLVRLPRGFARRAVVTSVTETEVVLVNPDGKSEGTGRSLAHDVPEELRLPSDFPCTQFTGVVSARHDDALQPGDLLRRWPVHGPWTRQVSFGHWVSHQPQGMCEDSDDCEAPATLWVSYLRGQPRSTDGPSCERCLARRLRRRERARGGPRRRRPPEPIPIAVWNTTLSAWDVRPHDGSPTLLA